VAQNRGIPVNRVQPFWMARGSRHE
jgi:hypothetical protein